MTSPSQARIDVEVAHNIKIAFGKDPVLCARQLFPHWFPRPMPWFHRGLIAIFLRRADFLLNFGDEIWPDGASKWTKKKLAKLVRCFRYKIDPANSQSPTAPIFRVRYAEDGRTPVAIDMVLATHVCLVIPRGFSKTTVCNFCNLYKCLYGMTKFTVYISESAPHAEDQLATIQRELSSNMMLIALFGNLKPSRADEEKWGAKGFETTTGVKFAARGSGAQIRGLNKFGDRPDCIVLDDVQKKDTIENPTIRSSDVSWFVSDVSEALPRGKEGYIYVIGTLLHPEALLPILEKDPDYTTIRFGAIDPEGEALWDDKAGLTLEQIQAKKLSFAAKGKLYEFGLELMSEIRNEDQAKFKREYFKYSSMKKEDFIARSIHIDPAISKGPDADYCALAVVGITEKGHKHVLDFYARQGIPFSEQAERYFEMKMKWECTVHSCEATAYQKALVQVIRELMFIKAKTFGSKAYFEIIETYPKTAKIERVEGIIQPLLAAGYLTFQQVWPELEAMFMEWPRGKLDGPDCIAGAIANLEPYAALSYGDGDALAQEDMTDPDYEAPCMAGSGDIP